MVTVWKSQGMVAGVVGVASHPSGQTGSYNSRMEINLGPCKNLWFCTKNSRPKSYMVYSGQAPPLLPLAVRLG